MLIGPNHHSVQLKGKLGDLITLRGIRYSHVLLTPTEIVKYMTIQKDRRGLLRNTRQCFYMPYLIT